VPSELCVQRTLRSAHVHRPAKRVGRGVLRVLSEPELSAGYVLAAVAWR
jgi:hypothetical protein